MSSYNPQAPAARHCRSIIRFSVTAQVPIQCGAAPVHISITMCISSHNACFLSAFWDNSLMVAPIAQSNCSIILHFRTWPLSVIVHCSLWKGATKSHVSVFTNSSPFLQSNYLCKWSFATCEVVYEATTKFVCFTKFVQCDTITLSEIFSVKNR